MKIRGFFLLGSLALSIGLRGAGTDDVSLPEKLFPQLDGILKNAVQQSPRMLSRVLDLEIAENGRIQARANLLPTFGGSANLYKAWDSRADIPGRLSTTKTYYNFTLYQPIYYWGERSNNAKVGEIQLAISQGTYREAYRLLVQELRGSYMGLIAQKVTVKRARLSLELATSRQVQGEDRLTKKVISDADIFPIRLEAEKAQIWLERNEFEYANAKASFARLAGISPLSDDAIPDAVPVLNYTPVPYENLLAGYLGQKNLPSTEAVNAKRMIEIQNLNYKSQKTALLPKFNFVAGSYQDEQSYTINVAQKFKVNSVFAGFGVSWSIFDGFSSRSNARATLARRRQMENDYRLLTERLTEQAQTQVKQLGFAARNLSISERSLSSTEATFNAKKEEFNRGLRSDADVSQARIDLYDAEIGATNLRIDFLLRISEFLGTVVEDPVLANVTEK